MTTFEEFKNRATQAFEGIERRGHHRSPIDLLYSMRWQIPSGLMRESKVAAMTLAFKEESCLVRSIKAAVIGAEIYRHHKLYAAEVYIDYNRKQALQKVIANPNATAAIEELLVYESPHIIIMDDQGNQFDPIFKMLDRDNYDRLLHPRVSQQFDLWKSLHGGYLVAEAARQQEAARGFNILKYTIDQVAPELLVVKENMAAAWARFGSKQRAIELLEDCLNTRMNARTLFNLWLLTEDEVYKKSLVKIYGTGVFSYFDEEVVTAQVVSHGIGHAVVH